MELYQSSLGEEATDEIELTLDQYTEAKEHYQTITDRADAARRLADNDDFKNLIMTGYLTDEPQRLAELIASGRLNEKTVSDCSRQLVSIGDFRGYMKNIIEQGGMAADELKDLEMARDESIAQEEAKA